MLITRLPTPRQTSGLIDSHCPGLMGRQGSATQHPLAILPIHCTVLDCHDSQLSSYHRYGTTRAAQLRKFVFISYECSQRMLQNAVLNSSR